MKGHLAALVVLAAWQALGPSVFCEARARPGKPFSRNFAADTVELYQSSATDSPAAEEEALDVTYENLTPATLTFSYLMPAQGRYFQCNVPKPTGDMYEHIDVNLASIDGDVDMYITLDPSQPPSTTHWQYSSTAYDADDYDVIHVEDVYFKQYCQGKPSCDVFIYVVPSVWSLFRNNTFFIGVTPSSSNLLLEDGVTLVDHAMVHTWDYYMYTLAEDPGKDASVIISLTPYSGDPDAYASTSIIRPNTINHDPGKFSNRANMDLIQYFDEDASWCPNGFPCHFYIGVVAFSGNVTYGITAYLRSNNSITLVDGQPLIASTQQGEDTLFKYTIPPTNSILAVQVAPIYGDPDL
jgi:hypothetical protein